MILIFTPVHGWFDIILRVLDRIDKSIKIPFIHYIYDDFSPPEDSKKYQALAKNYRYFIHCKTLGFNEFQPNLGRIFRNAWDIARATGYEALFFLGYNIILPSDGIIGFQRSQRFYGSKGGAFAPIVEKDGKIVSFAGICENHFGVSAGARLNGLEVKTLPRCECLSWASTGCLWIPKNTLQNKRIEPDPDFDLYRIECDLSKQILAEKLDVLITDQVIVQCISSLSTSFRFGENGRKIKKLEAKNRFEKKWGK